jgi:two-component system LytT family sensor kinase
VSEATLPKPRSTTAAPRKLKWIAWAAVVTGLLVVKIGGQATTPGAQTATDLRWTITPAVMALVDLFALFAALRLSKRYPLGPSQPLRHFGPHALAALAYGALHFSVDTWVEPGLDPIAATHQDTWLVRLGWDVLGYAMWAGVAHAVEYARRYRASRASAQRLQSELADAGRRRAESELRALKAELNPHLMSNALGVVSSLVRSDGAAARRVLAQLGDMLRAAVLRGGIIEVTLGEEIEGLAPFLAIERTRHGDRLVVSWDVDDAAREAHLPHMTLQPLLEYVAESTLAHRASARVGISATRRGGGVSPDQLCIAIRSDDTDMQAAATDDTSTATAIANVRARIEELYGTAASLESRANGVDGATVRLMLPWRDDDSVDDTRERDVRVTASESLARPRVRTVPMLLTAWFGIAYVATATSLFETPLRNGLHRPLGGALLEGFLGAALTTAMLYVAIRITYSTTASWRSHAVAALGLGLANAANKVLFVAAVGAPYPPVPLGRLVASVVVGAFLYGILMAVVQAIAYARRDRGNEVTALRLRTELATVARRRAESELRALKAQLNPHFLGNALSVVSTLLRSDPTAAEQVIGQLDGMLQSAAARSNTQEVTLGEEISGLAPFIALERARFGDHLSIRWDVDEAALSVRVPHMILQPLLENAVKHGLSARAGMGEIVVAGRRSGRQLEVLVRDDGVGLAAAAGAPQDWRTGTGLANARSRLAELYGNEASLDLVSGGESGTVARLTLPWRDDVSLTS